jgi:hypothetical protein
MKEPMGKSNKPAAKIRVSQATIDKIKKMGMTKALAGTKSANPEMKEALTRMYGARRVAAASTTAKSAPRGAMVDMGKVAPKMPGKGPAVNMAAPTKTMYNRLTGEKITYKDTPKAASKPKAPVKPPKYNRYTQQKVK